VYSNFAGNFLGFVIGMASARLVSHFFTTRSIKNLWGLTARKTVVDKQTFSAMEWMISILIGFIVFEIISKWAKKQMDKMLPKYKLTRWLAEPAEEEAEKTTGAGQVV
jgi:choline-glycine betaine transporter